MKSLGQLRDELAEEYAKRYGGRDYMPSDFLDGFDACAHELQAKLAAAGADLAECNRVGARIQAHWKSENDVLKARVKELEAHIEQLHQTRVIGERK